MSAKIQRKPGDKHGRLTLIKEVGPDRWGGRQFLFQCVCGKTTVARWGITISCGCAQKDALINKLNYSKRLGYGAACLNFVYARYKSSATSRKREFKLTKEQFKALTSKPCTYCGQEPKTVETKYGDAYGEFVYNGLDRVDNTVGYIESNVVPCCRTCNVAKRAMTVDAFKLWVKQVCKFLQL